MDALNAAIDKEEEMGGKVVETKEKEVTKELNFDELMNEFNNIIANIPGSSDSTQSTEDGKKFFEYWVPRITEITVKYLGTGKKVTQCTRAQVEQLSLIVDEVSELVKG